MRSSSGKYFPGLDHVRALAAFLVVVWHFAHGFRGDPVPFNQAPALGLLDEGHVGVSLFMVLSGYLFAKLIGGKRVDYPAFLYNRALRLLPLLMLALLGYGLQHHSDDLWGYAKHLAQGIVRPVLPNGGWSITAEAHFYVLLPALLWAAARWKWAPLLLVAAGLAVRLAIFAFGQDVQDAAYYTLAGRIDQFALGILFSQVRIGGRWAALAALGIALVYSGFDALGGFYDGPDWPWLFLPALEGLAFAAVIAWYDANPIRSPKMWLVQKAGEYSYSIYLLHFFLVFEAARFIDRQVMGIDNLYLALPWALLFFLGMTAIGHVSFVVIERPPLRWRRRYIRNEEPLAAEPRQEHAGQPPAAA